LWAPFTQSVTSRIVEYIAYFFSLSLSLSLSPLFNAVGLLGTCGRVFIISPPQSFERIRFLELICLNDRNDLRAGPSARWRPVKRRRRDARNNEHRANVCINIAARTSSSSTFLNKKKKSYKIVPFFFNKYRPPSKNGQSLFCARWRP